MDVNVNQNDDTGSMGGCKITSLVPEPTDQERIQTTPFHEQPGRSFASPTNAHEERMLRWFTYDHLPPKLHPVSAPFCELATMLAHTLRPGPERTVAFRKLLEAKDAAVRAAIHPGA